MTKLLFASVVVLVLVLGPGPGPCEAAAQRTHSLEHQGRTRTYHVVVPKGHDKKRAVPLVLALHGGGGNGKNFDRMTNMQFAREADKRGWVVVFPDGVAKGWNDGRKLVSARDNKRRGVDDVGFLGKLIDRLHQTMGIDKTRVYATGISNGGFMSFRLGLELSDRIAAIAPVTANLQRVHDGKEPAHPVGLFVINGTADPLVPYKGGEVRVLWSKRGAIFSTKETIRRWAAFTGCKGEPTTEALPDRNRGDGTTTVCRTWATCRDGAQVKLYRIQGGGHTWPGGRQYLPRLVIGRTSRDFDAVPVIFDFFAKHRRAPTAPAAAK